MRRVAVVVYDDDTQHVSVFTGGVMSHGVPGAIEHYDLDGVPLAPHDDVTLSEPTVADGLRYPFSNEANFEAGAVKPHRAQDPCFAAALPLVIHNLEQLLR